MREGGQLENNNLGDFSPDFQNDFRLTNSEPTTHDKVRVRCPQCFKLFSVSVHTVSEPRPRFACTSCETQFWIPFPECLDQEELLGFPVSWLEEAKENVSSHLSPNPSSSHLIRQSALAQPSEAPAPLEARTVKEDLLEEPKVPCPKCGAKHKPTAEECQSCGIIFSNYLESAEDAQAGFKVNRQLREAWKTLINEFDKPSLHEEFISLCSKDNRLDYAAYRYGRVSKACPEDEVSKKMLERVEGLITASAQAKLPGTSDAIAAAPAKEKKPWYAGFRISTVIISIGLLLMAVGYFLPAFRNIVGLGAATIFLAIAIRIYFPRN